MITLVQPCHEVEETGGGTVSFVSSTPQEPRPPKHFVCAIGKANPENWELCKQVSAYGRRRNRKRPDVQPGDSLFIWMGGLGYKALTTAAGGPRTPLNRAEAPWPGGTIDYTMILPFTLQIEVKTPVFMPFDGQYQIGTAVTKALLQHSFGEVDDEAAAFIVKALRERLAEEEATSMGMPD